jgi:hypothetical protein
MGDAAHAAQAREDNADRGSISRKAHLRPLVLALETRPKSVSACDRTVSPTSRPDRLAANLVNDNRSMFPKMLWP